MNLWLKKWSGFCVFLILLICMLGCFIWVTSRPVSLKAEELTLAEPCETYPGTELSLDLTKYQINLTFVNNSGAPFDHGDPPDCDLEVLLDGAWYYVPYKDYATAGTGRITQPGETFSFQPILKPYGKLPDGQYRLAFGYWYYDPAWEGPQNEQPFYMAYARFDVADSVYVLPQEP